MIDFALPWILLALPLPFIIYLLPSKSKGQAAALPMPELITGIKHKTVAAKKNNRPLVILSLIWALLVLASSQPQWLGEAVDIPTQGREMMIAVDLSGSMEIEDMHLNNRPVDRLTMLKKVLGDFITRRVGDRLGLILFADDAYMQTPMTHDRTTVQQMLDESVLGLVGRKTAIGDAMALAVKRFDNNEKESNRVLLLLTDGENTSGKITPEQALELAVAKDITIYTIGIGADVMYQKTIFGGSRQVNPSASLDEESLQNIADQTGGQYFRARDSQAMSEIYQLIDELEPVEQNQQQMRPLSALFYWPLGIAMLISFISLLFAAFPVHETLLNRLSNKVDS